MAAKLYECRDTAKAFFKEQYKEKLQPYTHILKEVMKANNLKEIPALLKISKTQHYQENGIGEMMATRMTLITQKHQYQTTRTNYVCRLLLRKLNVIPCAGKKKFY